MKKPDGSIIEEIDDLDGRIYRWKNPGGRPSRFLIAAFLGFWLCGWSAGFVSAVKEIMGNNPNTPILFLSAWLGAWTIGGFFAFAMLYLILRPQRPQSIKLGVDFLQFDPGTLSPITGTQTGGVGQAYQSFDHFRKAFLSRKLIEIPRRELGEIVLERVGERQRLTFDHGADRIEIGENLREPEREWLVEVIRRWKDAP